MNALAWVVLAGGATWGVMSLLERWRVRRFVQGFMQGAKSTSALLPESRYVVTLSVSEVSCARPEGVTERVAWDDLHKVEIVTTDRGPLLPDVFWVLHGSRAGCVVPQGATGEPELLARLQQLPGFRNSAVTEAMACSENRRFVCWRK